MNTKPWALMYGLKLEPQQNISAEALDHISICY